MKTRLKSIHNRGFVAILFLIAVFPLIGYVDTKADTKSENAVTINDLCEKINCEDISRDQEKASYALGVKFEAEIGSKFDNMDYSVFLKGIKDRKDNSFAVNSVDLDKDLENIIPSKVEASEKFLKEIASSTSNNIIEVDGVFVEKLSDWPNTMTPCSTNGQSDSGDLYSVCYARLSLDANDKNLLNTDKDARLIRLKEEEMIRGWRTVLREMDKREVWAVAIPPALAYGSKGAKDVAPGVALYFVLELVEAPQTFLDRIGKVLPNF